MKTSFFRPISRFEIQSVIPLVFGVGVVLGLSMPLHAQWTTNPYPAAVNDDTPFTIEMDIFATLPNEPPTSNWQASPSAIPALMTLVPAYDGSGRVFTNSIRGRIYSLDSNGGGLTTYLDIRSYFGNPPGVTIGMQQGLQSFAFHPDYNKPGEPGYGKFYTVHTTSVLSPTPDYLPGAATVNYHEVLMEWSANNPLNATYDGGAPREVLRIGDSNNDHNFGTLAFNRNSAPGSDDYGKLYMSLGDGGGVGNPNGLSGTGLTPFGSIMRIDPLGNNSANGKYGIPSDNPFVDADPKLDELWLYGLRNSQRFSFDSAGDQNMFFGDIGQAVIEEVNVGVKGGHYGWNTFEGSFDYDPVTDTQVGIIDQSGTPGYVFAVAEYDHSAYVDPVTPGTAVSMSGGYVYRDHHFSPLYGKYIFGDLVSGRLMVIDADDLPTGGWGNMQELIVTDNGVATTVQTEINQQRAALGLSPVSRSDLRFGIGEFGEIFIVNKQDRTIRVLRPVSLQLGDTDGDGDVDFDDFINVQNGFGGAGLGDTDGDRDVDFDDFINVQNFFGTPAPGISAVPEPASLTLLGLGLTLVMRRRR